jgi:hypothetical protein
VWPAPALDFPGWTQIGGPTRDVYAGGGEIFATRLDGADIYRYRGPSREWEKIDSPDGQGVSFGVNEQGYLFGLYNNGVWSLYPPSLRQLSETGASGNDARIYAGGDEILVQYSEFGNVYRYNRELNDWHNVASNSFSYAINDRGRLFAVADGLILAWVEYHSPGNPGGSNETIASFGDMNTTIYAGGSELFATHTSSGSIHRYTGLPNNWVRIGGPGSMFVVNSRGQLFALSPDRSSIWVWTGRPDEWEQIGGPARAIFGGTSSGVCATSPETWELWCYDQ